MNLYLVQHAQPKSKEEDPDRPLSEQGYANIRKVSAYLQNHTNIQVNHIYHSGKTRARQTAEVLSEYITSPVGKVDGLSPMDDVSIWAKRLEKSADNLLLVGHLPHLCKLSAQLLCGNVNKEIVAFKMSGVVCLSKDEAGTWSLQWMITPDIM